MGMVYHRSEPLATLVVAAEMIWILAPWAQFSGCQPISVRWTSPVKVWEEYVWQKLGGI